MNASAQTHAQPATTEQSGTADSPVSESSVQLKAQNFASATAALSPFNPAAVQLKEASYDAGVDALSPFGGGAATPSPGAVARAGVQNAASPLPYADEIQRSFGRHDISGLKAQVGGAAGEAAGRLGAEGYAVDGKVAFRGSPSKHTAAHEAAHVIQQRHGVQLKSEVGEAGDAYEKHADEVADAVVRGDNAEPILDRMAGAGKGSEPSQTSVQMFLGAHVGRNIRRPGLAARRMKQLKEGVRIQLPRVDSGKLVQEFLQPTFFGQLPRGGNGGLTRWFKGLVYSELTRRVGAKEAVKLVKSVKSGQRTAADISAGEKTQWTAVRVALKKALQGAVKLQSNRLFQQAHVDKDIVAAIGGAMTRVLAGESRLAKSDLAATRDAMFKFEQAYKRNNHGGQMAAVQSFGRALSMFNRRYSNYFERLRGVASTAATSCGVVAAGATVVVGVLAVKVVGAAAVAKGLLTVVKGLGTASMKMMSIATAAQTAVALMSLAKVAAKELRGGKLAKRMAGLVRKASGLKRGGSIGASYNFGPAMKALLTRLGAGRFAKWIASKAPNIARKHGKNLLKMVQVDVPGAVSLSRTDSGTFVGTLSATLTMSLGTKVSGSLSYTMAAVGEHEDPAKALQAMLFKAFDVLGGLAGPMRRAAGITRPDGSTILSETGKEISVGFDTSANKVKTNGKKGGANGSVSAARHDRTIQDSGATSESREVNLSATGGGSYKVNQFDFNLSLSATYQSIVKDLNWDNNGEYIDLDVSLEGKVQPRLLKRSDDAKATKAYLKRFLGALDKLNRGDIMLKIRGLYAKLKQAKLDTISKTGNSALWMKTWKQLGANEIKWTEDWYKRSRKAIESGARRQMDKLDAMQGAAFTIGVNVDRYLSKSPPQGWAMMYQRVGANIGADIPSNSAKKGKKKKKKRGGDAAGHSVNVALPVSETIGTHTLNYVKQTFMRDKTGGVVIKGKARTQRKWWKSFIAANKKELTTIFGRLQGQSRKGAKKVFDAAYEPAGKVFGEKGFDKAMEKLEDLFLEELSVRKKSGITASVAEIGRHAERGHMLRARRLAAPLKGNKDAVTIAKAILDEAQQAKVLPLLAK